MIQNYKFKNAEVKNVCLSLISLDQLYISPEEFFSPRSKPDLIATHYIFLFSLLIISIY